MENVLKRHVNLVALVVVLLAQVIGLAYQIKVRHGNSDDSVRLIRVWTVGVIAPMEKAVVHTADFFSDIWHNYFYLRSVRLENERLTDENTHLRLEEIRLAEDAAQAQRLKSLLKFKEEYVSESVAAQVIGGSGSELSRVVYLDKGSRDGIKPDMAVINPTGVVGKIIRVFPTTSQVLEINDQTSGIGAILETTRLQGILKGTPAGDAQLNYVMADETVKPGERVLTSGGDHIFPKGLPVGTVTTAGAGEGLFLNIRVKPAANLNRLEEVLVITKISDRDVEAPADSGKRAADILADRLPSIPVKPPEQPGAAGTSGTTAQPGAAGTTRTAKPGAAGKATATKPAGAAAAKPSTSKPTTGAAKPKTITDLPPTSGSAKPASGAASTASSGTSAKPKSPATSTTPGASTAPKKSATPASPKTPDNQPPADNKPHTETTPQ
jgi:rod shape-determining protein MreC